MPEIDIIIPAYNCSAYLDQCLESLVRQSFESWHAIVVDDGSTDGSTSEICDKWAISDSRVEILHLEKNVGIAHARNIALRKCTAPLVGFLDSDDFLDSCHLESLYSSLKEADADISMGGMHKVRHNGKHYKISCQMPSGTILRQPEIYFLTVTDKIITSHLWNKLYKRELFEGIEFPVGRNYEDFAIMLQVMERCQKVIHTGLATYNYRKTPSGITHTLSPKNCLDHFEACRKRLVELKTVSLLSDYEKASLSIWLCKTMLTLYRRVSAMPQSVEQQSVRNAFLKYLCELNISPSGGVMWLQMVTYSVHKRVFYYRFMKKHHLRPFY